MVQLVARSAWCGARERIRLGCKRKVHFWVARRPFRAPPVCVNLARRDRIPRRACRTGTHGRAAVQNGRRAASAMPPSFPYACAKSSCAILPTAACSAMVRPPGGWYPRTILCGLEISPRCCAPMDNKKWVGFGGRCADALPPDTRPPARRVWPRKSLNPPLTSRVVNRQ